MRWLRKNSASHDGQAVAKSVASRFRRQAAVFLAAAFVIAVLFFFHIPVGDSHSEPLARLHGKVRIRRNPKDGAEVVYVPPGRFIMSRGVTPAEALAGGTWPHPVRITRGFWIYRTEITNTQYRRFVNEAHARTPRPSTADQVRFNGPDQPVIGVSWKGAAGYCHWAGGRLPTEAEWEYAAGGAAGREYPWGNTPPTPQLAVYGRNMDTGGPEPVGGRPDGAGPFGTLDMSGSVWEWCADWSGVLGFEAAIDPQGPAKGSWRVVKGGAWLSPARALRVRGRYGYEPIQRPFTTGFRPVLPESAAASLLPD